ncbi:MAG: DUF2927 domain-containing protein [Pseudomonadota bacterium]
MTQRRRILWPVLGAVLFAAGCTPPVDWAAYERFAVAEGLHRMERTPPDAPYSDRDLIRNFQHIAFGVEAMLEQEAREVPLRRWSGPVIYQVEGQGVTQQDRIAIREFMARMETLSGIEVREGRQGMNFLIFILDRRDRSELTRMFGRLDGRGAEFLSDFIGQSDDAHPCRGTITTSEEAEIGFAAVLIKDETVGRLRQTCIEEEISQSFGLTNDHPEVRPSLFNDDQEFALLTDHDAALLQMLYHPILRPGMRREEAEPLLSDVLDDLRRQGKVVVPPASAQRPAGSAPINAAAPRAPVAPGNRSGTGNAG